MKKILFSDLDGTLLKGLRVSIKDRLAIQKEIKNELLFVISSGRNLKSFKQFLFMERIKFNYAILGNGSQIIDEKKKIINEVTFEITDLLEVLPLIIGELGLKIKVAVTHNNKTMIIKHYKISDDYKIKKAFPDKVSHCCLSIKNQSIEQENMQRIISNIHFLNVEMNGSYIDITAKNINKAYGISKVLEYVEVVKTYGIGDSYNDISMLKAVDFAFSMKSGTKEIRNIADMEVTSVKECIEVIRSQ